MRLLRGLIAIMLICITASVSFASDGPPTTKESGVYSVEIASVDAVSVDMNLIKGESVGKQIVDTRCNSQLTSEIMRGALESFCYSYAIANERSYNTHEDPGLILTSTINGYTNHYTVKTKTKKLNKSNRIRMLSKC